MCSFKPMWRAGIDCAMEMANAKTMMKGIFTVYATQVDINSYTRIKRPRRPPKKWKSLLETCVPMQVLEPATSTFLVDVTGV